MTNILTVTELSHIIKKNIPTNIFTICGEISQSSYKSKLHSSGHIYFNLKDNDTNFKCIIWKSKNINRDLIFDGNLITIDVKIDLYSSNGSISLIVDKIITTNGKGELIKKYELIKQQFFDKGYFDISRKKTIPPFIKNILVLTSENGAALQDFKINLDNNHSNIKIDIINVIVQGIECPKNICDVLNNIKNNNIFYDIVVITRGGGSFEDLFGFSQPELIETIYHFHLPILSAIGHQIDNPLIDLIADISTPTPSLAAQFIIDHNKNYLNDLNNLSIKIKNQLINTITDKITQLDCFHSKLLDYNISHIKYQCQTDIINFLYSHINKLDSYDNQLNDILNLSIYHDHVKITDPNILQTFINKQLKISWGNYVFNCTISL